MYQTWKKIHDLIVDAGYQYSKDSANAVKDMMSYTEKLAVIEDERQKMLLGAKGDPLFFVQCRRQHCFGFGRWLHFGLPEHPQ